MNNPWWYSLFNPTIWVICFLIAFINYSNESRGGKLVRSNDKGIIFLLFVLFLLNTLFTLRGGDDVRYREFVEISSLNYGTRDFYSLEYYYYLVAWFVNNNYLLWKIVVYVPALILTYISLVRLKANTYASYMAFSIFCLASFGAARAILAYSVFLFAYSFWGEFKLRTWIIVVAIVIGSQFFHSSMIIPIVLTPFALFKITKKRLWIFVLIFPLMVMLFNRFYPLLYTSDDLMAEQYGYKFNTYTDEGAVAGSHYFSSILSSIHGYYGVFVILYMLYLAVKVDGSERLPINISRIIRLSFLLAYVSLVILASSLLGKIPIFMRYVTMIPFFLFVTWPYLLNKSYFLSKRKRDNLILLSAGYLFIKFAMYFYYALL